MATDLSADIAAVQGIAAVPCILEVVCRSTGIGFAAVARVTEQRWVCRAVRHEIEFGLVPGGELEVETTLCHEIRQRLRGRRHRQRRRRRRLLRTSHPGEVRVPELHLDAHHSR